MKLLALLLSLAFLVGCGARVSEAPLIAPTPAPAARFLSMTIHTDETLNERGRAVANDAASSWATFTDGHIRFELAFDLSPKTLPDLLAAGAPTMLAVSSESVLARRADALLARDGTRPSAATFQTADDRFFVVLIVDRITTKDFGVIIQHELGHVAGFPDLPTMGDVMSAQYTDESGPASFTSADRALCRGLGYCR